ncbi:MAG: hypothetical protein QXT53_02595 [Ignisphaera sp.]
MSDAVWLADVLAGVKGELEPVCSRYAISGVCGAVLEGVAEVFPTWFSGRRKSVVAAVILYLSLLIARGVRKGFLKDSLDLLKASKPAVIDAFSRIAFVDWDSGVLYLDQKLFNALAKKIKLQKHVKPYSFREVVRNRVVKVYPGIYSYLDFLCTKLSGKDFLKTLLEEPATARKVLLEVSVEWRVVEGVAEKIMETIAELLGVGEKPQKLAQLLFENPEELGKVFKNLLAKSSR